MFGYDCKWKREKGDCSDRKTCDVFAKTYGKSKKNLMLN